MDTQKIWAGRLVVAQWNCRINLVQDTDDLDDDLFEGQSTPQKPRLAGNHIENFSQQQTPYRSWHYNLLDDEESFIPLDAATMENQLHIETFMKSDDLEESWLETPYNVLPYPHHVRLLFNTIRQALLMTNKIAVGRIVLANRDQAVLIMPHGDILRLWTLNELHSDIGVNATETSIDPTDHIDPEQLYALFRFIQSEEIGAKNNGREPPFPDDWEQKVHKSGFSV